MKLLTKIVTVAGLAFGAKVYADYKKSYKIPLEQYKAACLYMAVMDDEICRNELEGQDVNGRPIGFPPRRESLPYRNNLFIEMNKGLTRDKLEDRIEEIELRLRESRAKLHENQDEQTEVK